MKQFISLMMVVLTGILPLSACVHNKQQAAPLSDVTVLVMDTTQALLEGAQVTIGKTVCRTSWDGRVVLTPSLLSGAKKMSVVCDGYEPVKVSLKAPLSSPLMVALTPKPVKAGKHGKPGGYLRRDGRADGVMFLTKTSAVMSAGADAYATAEEKSAIMPARPGRGTNGPTAGKLTAGEVNDFAKWYFWPRVVDGSHKQFVAHWKMNLRNRYTVQVTNKNGAPVASRAVSLLDGKGNTLFQAVTDNTGKAELWAYILDTAQRAENLQIRVDERLIPAKPWSEGLNVVSLDEPCEVSDAADVVFIFDATGSMGDELRYLQEEMKDVIARAAQATGGLTIRTGAVVYRDHPDEYVTRISRLTTDIKTTQAFIDKQEANGGGDYEEAVPEALMAALNSAGWDDSARARIAFLVLDAPCHQDSATLALLHEQILNAAALGVRLVPVVCSGLGESGELLLRFMALATNGTSFFLTDDSGIGHTHLKPTTDSLKVEHLNDMLVRTIVEFSAMPACTDNNETALSEEIGDEQFLPNPFDPADIETDPSIPAGPTTLYILDISGKLIAVTEGDSESFNPASLQAYGLPSGVYFVKAFYDGEWHTKKVLVR